MKSSFSPVANQVMNIKPPDGSGGCVFVSVGVFADMWLVLGILFSPKLTEPYNHTEFNFMLIKIYDPYVTATGGEARLA